MDRTNLPTTLRHFTGGTPQSIDPSPTPRIYLILTTRLISRNISLTHCGSSGKRYLAK